MPQLCGCGDHLGGNLLGQTLCLLPGQGQVHVQVGPDGVKECGVTQCVCGGDGRAQTVPSDFNMGVNGTSGGRAGLGKGVEDKGRNQGWGPGFTMRRRVGRA